MKAPKKEGTYTLLAKVGEEAGAEAPHRVETPA